MFKNKNAYLLMDIRNWNKQKIFIIKKDSFYYTEFKFI